MPAAPVHCPGFDVFSRPQFTFAIGDRDLACLLTRIVAPPTPSALRVNIVGILITKVKNCSPTNLVKMVVGPDDPRSSAQARAALLAQVAALRRALRRAGIRYQERNVIELCNLEAAAGTPGAFRKAYTALVCAGIDVRASYQGEPCGAQVGTSVGSMMFEVPRAQLRRALARLCAFNLADPEPQLCINLDNVHTVCRARARNGNPCAIHR